MLGETAVMVRDAYRGDLRRLREEAGRDPQKERALLKKFKGMGDVGVDIFIREMQIFWGENYPFLGKKELRNAKKLGLGKSAAEVAKLVPKKEFPKLAAALVRLRNDEIKDLKKTA